MSRHVENFFGWVSQRLEHLDAYVVVPSPEGSCCSCWAYDGAPFPPPCDHVVGTTAAEPLRVVAARAPASARRSPNNSVQPMRPIGLCFSRHTVDFTRSVQEGLRRVSCIPVTEHFFRARALKLVRNLQATAPRVRDKTIPNPH
jgi:hypothetical protein